MGKCKEEGRTKEVTLISLIRLWTLFLIVSTLPEGIRCLGKRKSAILSTLPPHPPPASLWIIISSHSHSIPDGQIISTIDCCVIPAQSSEFDHR